MLKKVKISCFFCLLCFFSCQMNISENDLYSKEDSAKIENNKRSLLAYMGGSVLYAPKNQELSQLYKDSIINIRLGKLTATPGEYGENEFTDNPDKALYGELIVSNISEEMISFDYILENQYGEKQFSSNISLSLNESIDIDNDNNVDLAYVRPAIDKKNTISAVYLTFISSQENLTTSMYCIDPSQNSRGVYKGGLMGINPNGEYLYSLYETDRVSRTLISDMKEGEYVFDAIRGDFYQAVREVNNRTLSNNDLIEVNFDRPEN